MLLDDYTQQKKPSTKAGGNLYLWPELILTELTLANCCSVIPSKYRKVMKSASLLKTQEYDVSDEYKGLSPRGGRAVFFYQVISYYVVLHYIVC